MLAPMLASLTERPGADPFAGEKVLALLHALADPDRRGPAGAVTPWLATARWNEHPGHAAAALAVEIAAGYWSGGAGVPAERLLLRAREDPTRWAQAMAFLPPAWRLLEEARLAIAAGEAHGADAPEWNAFETDLLRSVGGPMSASVSRDSFERGGSLPGLRAHAERLVWPEQPQRARLLGVALRATLRVWDGDSSPATTAGDELRAAYGDPLPAELRSLAAAFLDALEPAHTAAAIDDDLATGIPLAQRPAAEVVLLVQTMEFLGAETWAASLREIALEHPESEARRRALRSAVAHTRDGPELDRLVTALLDTDDERTIESVWESLPNLETLEPALSVERPLAWLRETLAKPLSEKAAAEVVDGLEDAVQHEGSAFARAWGTALRTYDGPGSDATIRAVREIGEDLLD
jgi:hypothetical protein